MFKLSDKETWGSQKSKEGGENKYANKMTDG